MNEADAVPVLCIYRVKDGKRDEFLPYLEKHWPTLSSVGLTSSEPARWYTSEDKDGRTCFVEIFEWKDARAPETAHETPEVMAVWEPMGALTDDMEFLHLERLG